MAVFVQMNAREHTVRPAREDELFAVLRLYAHLGDNPVPAPSEELLATWRQILCREGHTVLVAENGEGNIVSTCALTVVPNLTHDQRPYAVVENVVTLPEFRGNGYASATLNEARRLAVEAGCYKIMLMTGSRREATLNFYRKAGYRDDTKTAFDQRLQK